MYLNSVKVKMSYLKKKKKRVLTIKQAYLIKENTNEFHFYIWPNKKIKFGTASIIFLIKCIKSHI